MVEIICAVFLLISAAFFDKKNVFEIVSAETIYELEALYYNTYIAVKHTETICNYINLKRVLKKQGDIYSRPLFLMFVNDRSTDSSIP